MKSIAIAMSILMGTMIATPDLRKSANTRITTVMVDASPLESGCNDGCQMSIAPVTGGGVLTFTQQATGVSGECGGTHPNCSVVTKCKVHGTFKVHNNSVFDLWVEDSHNVDAGRTKHSAGTDWTVSIPNPNPPDLNCGDTRSWTWYTSPDTTVNLASISYTCLACPLP